MNKRIYITQKFINKVVENGISDTVVNKDKKYLNRLYNDLFQHYKHTQDNFGHIYFLQENIETLINYFTAVEDYRKCIILCYIQTDIVDDYINQIRQTYVNI